MSQYKVGTPNYNIRNNMIPLWGDNVRIYKFPSFQIIKKKIIILYNVLYNLLKENRSRQKTSYIFLENITVTIL